MRRKNRSGITGMTFSRPTKKITISTHSCSATPTTLLDEETYRRHKEALAKEMRRGLKNRDSVRILMRETAPNRRHWIVTDHPSVADIKKMFPCIADFHIVSNYNYCLVHNIYIFLTYTLCRCHRSLLTLHH